MVVRVQVLETVRVGSTLNVGTILVSDARIDDDVTDGCAIGYSHAVRVRMVFHVVSVRGPSSDNMQGICFDIAGVNSTP